MFAFSILSTLVVLSCCQTYCVCVGIAIFVCQCRRSTIDLYLFASTPLPLSCWRLTWVPAIRICTVRRRTACPLYPGVPVSCPSRPAFILGGGILVTESPEVEQVIFRTCRRW